MTLRQTCETTKSHIFMDRKNNGTASARTSDPGASVGRIVSRRIWMKTSISRRSGRGARSMLRKTFKMLRKLLFNVANLVRATSNERSFHRCCEFMCVMLRAAGVATFSVSGEILPRGARAVFLPPGSRLPRGGGGVGGAAPRF
jgi:hypothetical protein